ncbi:histidinol-phosphate aminotransferase [Collinsella sp. CAG:289]|nr:histidinol-phosphate aminotransferase [Collinsella sp. CAG:289]
MAELSQKMKELVQPYLASIEPYDPNFTPTRINLSANENTYPVPEGVREAVDAALATTPLNRYPDPMSNDLRDELAAWHGVPREMICAGNGGDELLYNFLLAFGGRGRTLLNCPPCFSEYAFFASLVETEVRDVWRDPKTFELDCAAVLEAAPSCDLAIVTSPNNPTGDVAPLDFVGKLCEACPGMVMVDEAYIEFADASFGAKTTAQGLIEKYSNLVILHTLSKAFGAAGTRCGYVIAAPEVIDVFAAIRQIYSVNVLTQAAALAAVRARDAYAPVMAQVAAERERVKAALEALAVKGLPVEVWPSFGNFLLVRMAHATRVRERLRDEYSILVRDFSYAPGLADCLRITVGTPAENDAVLSALAVLVKEEM